MAVHVNAMLGNNAVSCSIFNTYVHMDVIGCISS